MMRIITKLMLTLVMLVGAVEGVNATKLYADLSKATAAGGNVGNSEGTVGGWESSASGGYVFTWKGSSDARIVITDIVGSISSYEKLVIVSPEFSAAWRIDVEFSSGSTKTIGGAYYTVGTDKVIELSSLTSDELNSIKNIRINTSSESGSAPFTKIYLEKPTEFTFNTSGKAYLYPSDLTASSYGLDSYDDETGIVKKSTEGYGGISFDFGTEGFDFSNISNIEISIDNTYDDIRDYSNIDDLNSHTQYTSATGGAFTLDATKIDSNIKKWNLGLNSKTGSMKINYICFTANVLNASLGEEVAMSNLTSYLKNSSGEFEPTGYTPTYRINESTSAAYFGVDWSGENCQKYSDVEEYKAIRVYSAQGNVPRGMFFNSSADGQSAFNFTWNESGYYELALSTVYASVSNYKLISVRPAQGSTSSITGIYMVKDHPDYDYVISGSGIVLSSVTTVLSDASATAIDATGITKATALTTANPNCLIVANEGMVTNTQNVIVGTTCANLVLTDGYPFKAPADFTATAAQYTTTINTEAKAGTLCLPFAATIPDGVEAYTLTYTGGGNATATPVVTPIPANTPVLVNGSGEVTFMGSGAVSASAANVSGALTGVFAETTVPTGSYVLQQHEGGLGFYKVDSTAVAAKPFRAYLTAAGGGARLGIVYADEATGISAVEAQGAEAGAFYTLSGVRVSQPTKGIYVKNGKKVVVK